jgi:cupin superfamily acireductone dioxygenase involved in methionine salvage
VKHLQIKSLLARIDSEMHELEICDVNYQLDRRFSSELDELINRYGYTDQEVVELVELVEAHETHGSDAIKILINRIPPDVDSDAGGET